MEIYSKSKNDPLSKILRKLFEEKPGKSEIILIERCSDCGGLTIIEITTTSRGYGLQGGALFVSSNDKFKAKCLACYEKHFKIDDNQKNGK
jgi:hypothetical protein